MTGRLDFGISGRLHRNTQKGYTRVVTQAEERLARLWTKLFNLEIADTPPVQIAGHPHPYMTVFGTIPPCADPITMESNSALLLGIEGQWDALDHSGTP